VKELRTLGVPDDYRGDPLADADATLLVRQPATGLPLGEVPVAGREAVREAVIRSRAAQAGWGALPVADRCRRLMALHEVLGARAPEIIDIITAETGKPEVEAIAEVVVVLDLLSFYARRASRILRRENQGSGWLLWKRSYILREPFGVVGVISPWNQPLVLGMEPVVTALFAGNGAVLKPSEYTPFTGIRVGELCAEAGLPEGLVGVVPGRGATGAHLVEGGIDRLVFTGGSATGRLVMAAAARGLVPVTLELGGKDAAIVLEDADLERAARGVVFGAFFNAGQTCLAVERAYVVEAVYDRFLRRVAELTRELRPGSAGTMDVGPVSTPAQLRLVEEQVSDALARGARIVAGGGRTDPASNVLHPTILVNVDDGMRIMREETFGPVLPLIRVRDQEEAIRRVNATGFSLYGSVWTRDRARGEAVALCLRAGGVSVNDVLSHWGVPGLPVGGVGESGFGRRRGAEGLLEMTRSRTVLLDRGGFTREPWWFPYHGRTRRLMGAVLAWRRRRGLRGLLAGVRRYLLGGEP